jgi:concentrative nucleoside transporter, CNT family
MTTFSGPPVNGVSDKRISDSKALLSDEKQNVFHADVEVNDVNSIADQGSQPQPQSWFARNRRLVRRVKLCALAALILAWWISATIHRATRHRWIVQTFFAWSFIAIIAFRFIPTSVVTRPVEAVWVPFIQRPFFALPRYARYGMGWLALITIIVCSAFGFKLEDVGLSWLFFWTRFCVHVPVFGPSIVHLPSPVC